MALDSQSRKLASESLENQGLQEPEIEISGKGPALRFEEVNDVTWKLTDGRGTNAWSGDRSGSYRTTRAVAWLMGIGNGLWVVRYRNKVSRPMKLNAAKRYALEMVRGIRPGRVLVDPIGNLHQETLKASAPDEPARTWPIDVMGGHQRGLSVSLTADPDLRRAILDTERMLIDGQTTLGALQGDDYELTYDADGYPELPACLDRRTT